jgi:hypothetical protein
MPNKRAQGSRCIPRVQRETHALKNEGPTHWSGLRVKREERKIRAYRSIRRPAEMERPRRR